MPQSNTSQDSPSADLHAQPRELPTIAFAADGCVLGHWRAITLGVWGVQADAALVGELDKLSLRMATKYPRLSGVHLILNNTPLPRPEARAAFNALTERYANQLAGVATMLEGGGFWASALRGFITSLHVIGGRRFKFKTHGSIREVAEWLAPIHSADTGDPIDPVELENVLAWMLDQPSVRGHR